MPKIENCPFCGANMELLYFQRWMNANELVVGAYWQCAECKARSGDYYGSNQREAKKKATDALTNRSVWKPNKIGTYHVDNSELSKFAKSDTSDFDFHEYVSKIIEESEV